MLTAAFDGSIGGAAIALAEFDARVAVDFPVLLPLSLSPHGQARWAQPPNLTCPWLPPFGVVVAAGHAVADPARCVGA